MTSHCSKQELFMKLLILSLVLFTVVFSEVHASNDITIRWPHVYVSKTIHMRPDPEHPERLISTPNFECPIQTKNSLLPARLTDFQNGSFQITNLKNRKTSDFRTKLLFENAIHDFCVR